MNDIILCKRCGRKLKDEKAQQLGFGKVCYEKYLKSQKNYLFDLPIENKEGEKMFTHEDLIKFYKLLLRYDKTSNNIGVVEKYRFVEIYELYMKGRNKHPHAKMILNENKSKFTIIENELETTYILIQKPEDMTGRFFRKYI